MATGPTVVCYGFAVTATDRHVPPVNRLALRPVTADGQAGYRK